MTFTTVTRGGRTYAYLTIGILRRFTNRLSIKIRVW